MSRENSERRDPENFQHQAEHTQPRRKMSVLGYLAILFAVAFLLLLIAYFQQQRQSSETADALKQSVSAVDTIQAMMEENKTLSEENARLQKELEELRDLTTTLDSARREQNNNLNLLNDQLSAMDYLWRIQRYYSRGSLDEARALADEFEDLDLPSSLPRENPSGIEGPSPLDQYNALLDAMNYREEP